MSVQPGQQPDGVEPPTGADVPLFDPGNRLLMVRPVELVTGIYTHATGQRFGISTLRDQGTPPSPRTCLRRPSRSGSRCMSSCTAT